MSNSLPIGIFDSGIGGLTVTKAIMELLPSENLIYLGDTARVPYGIRDKKTITEFALEITNFLLKKKVKVLVVACNTISATSLNEIKKVSNVPVIDVIDPTVCKALESSKNKKIGVIGTRATVDSKAYDLEFDKKGAKVTFSKACPLFVPLAEEGFIKHKASEIIAKEYLSIFRKKVDVLILGCTHYPVLKELIQKSVGSDIALIDSANPTAEALKNLLEEKNLLNPSKFKGKLKFYVTDAPDRVYKIANIFFNGNFPGNLERIDLSK